MFRTLIIAAALAVSPALVQPAFAQVGAFHPGTYIKEFGPIASVDADQKIPKGAGFKVRFDVGDQAKDGEANKTLVSAARFLNLSVENGVNPKKLRVAVVVHGGATKDLTKAEGGASAPVIAALIDKGVDIYLCGQSAAAHGVAKEDLLPGVKMALSAMHAHVLLDAEGYSLIPF